VLFRIVPVYTLSKKVYSDTREFFKNVALMVLFLT
jgi:hypothetical protein